MNKRKKGRESMVDIKQTSLVVKRETIYDKIRKSLWNFMNRKDCQMMQSIEELLKPKRPKLNEKIIIPKEIRKDLIKK